MLFNSFEFLLFFPIVTLIYFLLPHKFRWFHLLAASCIFYMAFVPVYILILLVNIIIDYIAGIWIERSPMPRRKLFLVMSIVANVGFLCFFKYYNFFADNVNGLFHLTHLNAGIPLLHILLPIGLSFHTFQAMSYTIEVYRGNQKAERHFGIYALYVMFYPQLVAGPIERPQNLLHQFHEPHYFSYDDCVHGLRQMMWGLFKKAVIADRLGLLVDQVYKDPAHSSGTALVLGTILFAFQIYCDFSGYSDLALGAARVMGIGLMVNFNRPFNAKSMSEFWRKWHISLSTWLSDYIYTPLAVGLRNYGMYAVVLCALATFLISGLWHGAAWKYIVWGGLHGVAIAYEVLTKKKRKKLFSHIPGWLGKLLSLFLTFSYICFTFIFFRARNIREAVLIIRKIPHLFTEWKQVLHNKQVLSTILFKGIRTPDIIICICLVLLLEVIHKLQGKGSVSDLIAARPTAVRWGIYFVLTLSIYMFGIFNNRQFIYFQF